MFHSLDSTEMLTSIDKTFVVYMISQHIPASESASELNRFEFEIGIIGIGSESVLNCESVTSLVSLQLMILPLKACFAIAALYDSMSYNKELFMRSLVCFIISRNIFNV